VFCVLRDFHVAFYALTWSQATEFAQQLAKKYVKTKPAEQPCFYLLSVAHSEVQAERVKISRRWILFHGHRVSLSP